MRLTEKEKKIMVQGSVLLDGWFLIFLLNYKELPKQDILLQVKLLDSVWHTEVNQGGECLCSLLNNSDHRRNNTGIKAHATDTNSTHTPTPHGSP